MLVKIFQGISDVLFFFFFEIQDAFEMMNRHDHSRLKCSKQSNDRLSIQNDNKVIFNPIKESTNIDVVRIVIVIICCGHFYSRCLDFIVYINICTSLLKNNLTYIFIFDLSLCAILH